MKKEDNWTNVLINEQLDKWKQINKFSNFKYLGFHIENKINFSFKYSYVYNNLSRLHGIMYSVSKILFIMPVILGGISYICIINVNWILIWLWFF